MQALKWTSFCGTPYHFSSCFPNTVGVCHVPGFLVGIEAILETITCMFCCDTHFFYDKECIWWHMSCAAALSIAIFTEDWSRQEGTRHVHWQVV